MLQITIANDLCNARRCQPVSVVAGHSHSIVNEPWKASNDAGIDMAIDVNTMKNTMFIICC